MPASARHAGAGPGGPGGAGACLDETALAQFVEGAGSEGSRAAVERHIDACPDCFELVTRYAQAYLSHGEEGEAEAVAAAPLLRGDSVGRYVVLDCVGMGSMGTVYSAFDPELDRRVALKLLRVRPQADAGWRVLQPRLLREARALAQLSHPNVVTIHDVGALTQRVFIATELVEGCTLRAWLGQQPRGWREVIEVFLAAGEGLAAAHAAGIVHRDFKPDNVLVGADGRVRVADFGMARVFSAADAPPVATDDPDALAVTGALVGTPAYMAPEQLEGRPVDARSDQFSYCVALYEAVCGVRPFAGGTLTELAEQVRRGQLRPPPPERMPAWLAAIVIRGLAVQPAQRHADMRALLDALRATPRRLSRRRWLMAGALVLVATAVGGYAVAQQLAPAAESRLCRGAQDKLQGVWDGPTRAAAQAAFEAVRAPYAAGAWAVVRARLNAYAAAWTTAHTDNCLATRARGEQSEAAMDLRGACLDRRLDGLRALTGLLVSADAEVVLAAPAMAQALGGPETCGDVAALQARGRPDPGRPETAALQAEVATARALRQAGKLAQARSHAEAAHARAEELGLTWPAAEAQVESGRAQAELREDLAAAEQTLVDAVWAAEASGDVEAAADGWTELVEVRRARAAYPAAEEAARRADAAVHRVADPARAALLAARVGQLHSTRGQFEAALASHRAALAGFAALGPSHVADAARAQNDIGVALQNLGQPEAALVPLGEAAAALERAFGADHPDVAAVRNNTASALSRLGRRTEAVAMFRQVLAARERAFGRGHPRTLTALQNIAAVQGELGVYGEAHDLHRQALAIQERTLGPDHPDIGVTLGNLALTLRELGARTQTRALLERAVRLQERGFGPDHPALATSLISLAGEQKHAGELEAALAGYERALAIRVKRLGPDHELVGRAMKRVGDCQARLGRTDEAIASFERALTIVARGSDPFGLLEARMSLAGVLWSRPSERARAAQTMAELREQLRTMKDPSPQARAGVEAWFAAHPEAEALIGPAAAAPG
ncbi:serine/threonine-protein kinase [Nannocystis bainbridge]|uniref:Serine/threonine-protein kinase n=1 Tax=Nannocystis bainbridge TaxID=2995303 RepID=A0ABT5DR32_9BACT|nr:serine/threonine-protein kinase [Nannocystis bainbridge]MDC0715610.1 serine/threonine-protein kinase [Nannocystis bainbridge]